MDAVLNWLWQGAVVALAAAVMLRLLDRAHASVRCLICWAALVVVVALPFAAFTAAPATGAAATVTPPLVTVPNAWWTSSMLLVTLWLLWVAAYSGRIVASVVAVRSIRATSRTFPRSVSQSLAHWQRIQGAGRSAPLVLSDRVRAAAVLGCGAPVIAVASTLVARLDGHELDRVIVHEWAHVQRRDDLAKIAQVVIRAIAGWHPAVWWLDRRLSIEQELACDEMVVAVSGGAKSYASCLVKLASLRIAHANALLTAGALSSTGLRRRVARLAAGRTLVSALWSRPAGASVVAVLIGLALGIAPVRVVEAAVSVGVSRLLSPAATAVRALAEPVVMEAVTGVPRRTSTAPISQASSPSRGIPASDHDRADSAPGIVAASSPEAAPEADKEPVALLAGDPSPLLASPSPTPVASPPIADAVSRSVWSPAADAGVAIGRGSKSAGVATAGAFTRFAKKIAGSF